MASVRLAYSGTNVDFGPGEGFDAPKLPDRVRERAKDGTLYSYDFYTPKGKWIVPITDMSETDADNVNDWWEKNRTCSFYPDYTNDTATSYSVKITNDEQPLFYRYLSKWNSDFSGTLILEET